MTYIRIAFVSPYPELTHMGKAMAKELLEQGVKLEVTEAIGAEAASRLNIAADVAICRGVTGVALRQVLAPEIPLIEVKTTGYDVLQAIHECASNPANPKPYTVIGTRSMVYGLQQIMNMLGLELEFHLISSEGEARECFEASLRLGARTIIGGSTIVGVAERRGTPAVLIRSGEESLRQSIEEAIRVARVALQERTAAEQTRISLNSLAEGIIMLNTKGVVTECNTAAIRLLCGENCKEKDIIGKKASTLIPKFDSRKVLSGQEDFTLTHLANNITIAASYFPVIVNGSSRGAVASLQETSRVQALEGTIRHSLHQKGLVAKYTFEQCLGGSRVFQDALDKAKKYSLTQASVMLYGETGTGKEIIAQSMHNASPRSKGPFVAINCAAFPEALLESMLFGYVEGAFTGAAKGGKAGFFELAHGGTLFLDEVSEIPLYLQGRLLRVLQEKEVMRLGHDRIIPVDVRVIAATNRMLLPLTEQGMFRGDLFYRLNVLGLTLPPLRERGRDITTLAKHFIHDFCLKNGRRALSLNPEAAELLHSYPWPGNIRELRNMCERLGVLCPAHTAGKAEVSEAMNTGKCFGSFNSQPCQVAPASPNPASTPLPASLAGKGIMHSLARQAAQDALLEAKGNKGLAAKRLGISRTTLWRMLKDA